MIRTRGLAYRYGAGPPLQFADVDLPQGGTLLLQGRSGSYTVTLEAAMPRAFAGVSLVSLPLRRVVGEGGVHAQGGAGGSHGVDVAADVDELVAVAGDEVVAAGDLEDAAGELAVDLVERGLAVGRDDRLRVVDREHGERERLAVAQGHGDGATYHLERLLHAGIAFQNLDHVQAKAAVHQARQHAHLRMAEQLAGELRCARAGRQPAQVSAG